MLINQSTSLATWVYAIHRSLTEQGYQADEIMLRAGFDFSTLQSTTQRIPKGVVNAIWKEAELATGDDAFCISTFTHLNDPYLNALITSAQASSSVLQAIELLTRYYHLVTSSSQLNAKIGQNIELHMTSIDGETPVCSQDVDLVFGLVSKYGSVLPTKEMHPTKIFMARPRPRNIEAYEAHYDCPLVFDAGKNVLQFPIEILQETIPSANPMLSQHVEQYLAEQTNKQDEQNLIAAVEHTLKELLQDGTPKLKDIALRLNASERTLQRKLKQQSISYSDILNQVRLEQAQQLLRHSDLSIQKIAYQLGFTEPGNFIRFFKQQTGDTPNAFAKAVRSSNDSSISIRSHSQALA